MRNYILVCLVLMLSCKNEVKEQDLVVNTTNSKVITTADGSLEVYDYSGIEKFFTKQDDKVYVINFWATWCKPCIKELPHFEALNKNYKSKNVEVLLVSLDFPQQFEQQLLPYIKEKGLQSKVVALDDPDMNSWIPKISETWTGSIPATMIYNKDKRQFYEQSFNYVELENELKQFLK